MTKLSPNPVSHQKTSGFIYIVTTIAALGGLLFGYDTGVISGAILYIKQQFSLSSAGQEVVVSAVLVGAILGAAAGGLLSDRIGRRSSIILAAILFTIGGLGSAWASDSTWLIASRVIVGLGVGLASFISPLYNSEVAPKKIRGALVMLNQLAVTSGIVLAYLVDYGFSGVADGWRWMLGLSIVPAIALGVGMWFMPRSPRWLVSKNQGREAFNVLSRIRPSQANVEAEIEEIHQGIQQEQGDWRELGSPRIRKALIVGVGLAILQQVTGVNTVIYYAPTILQSAGFESAATSILGTTGIGVINVVFTIVAIVLIDRLGRRPLLLTGLVGMIVGLGALGLAFQLSNLGQALGWVAIVSLMVYIAGFAIGMGPVFWLLIAEIYPLNVRSQAMSIATVANWGANFVVALTFLSLTEWIGRSWTFWLYGIISVGAWLFVYYLVPETKGRSLEEIQQHWNR
ncbi:sugar porter family MFS transporter [Pseudanabaenaceae cyanobacterium LEGE 13415]|nr:sugar porter family MFS transporter [Pseudanabaenaceae cyanobacterium LEGE 13415]